MSDTQEKPKQKYKLFFGGHVEGRGPTRKMYKPGDVIESSFDLTTLNSKNPSAQKKFGRMYDDGSTDFTGPAIVRKSPMDRQDGESDADYSARLFKLASELTAKAEAAKVDNEKLDRMTVAELKKYADDNEIDLDGAIKKDEILEIIRTSRS